MKTTKIIYWISTILIGLFAMSGLFFINNPMAISTFGHLGLPDWFRFELTIGTFIGGLILILPMLSQRLKEWGYVALGIVYVSALIAHLSVDGIVVAAFAPILAFAILLASYLSYHKIKP